MRRSTALFLSVVALAACGPPDRLAGIDPQVLGRVEGTLLRRLAPAVPGDPFPGGSVALLSGRCASPPGACSPGSWRPQATTQSDATGRFRFEDLAPGVYRVFSPEAQGADRVVTVVEGRTTDGTLVLVADTATTEGTPGNGPVAAVYLTTDRPVASVGDSVNLRAKLSNTEGREVVGREVVWALSGSAAVFTFRSGPDAVLRITAAGTVTVTATSEGKTGALTLTGHAN